MRKFNIIKVLAKKQFNDFENVIYRIDCLYEHKNENNENEYAGINVSIVLKDPTSDSFIASENITKDTLSEWIQSSLSEEALNRYNEMLDKKLNEVVLDIQ